MSAFGATDTTGCRDCLSLTAGWCRRHVGRQTDVTTAELFTGNGWSIGRIDVARPRNRRERRRADAVARRRRA